LSPIAYRNHLGTGIIRVRHWLHLGIWGIVEQKHLLSLHEINVPEHGEHGMYCFRMKDFGALQTWMKDLNRKNDYSEISKG
jgi:hypothetical protein